MRIGGQRHAPAALCPRTRPGAEFTGVWVGPRASWKGTENFASTGIRSLDRPAPSESLYRLRYPGARYGDHGVCGQGVGEG